MKDQTQSLIEILMDKTARDDERDDAAIDLRAYKDIRALNALVKIASDVDEDHVLLDNCADSIGELFVEMNFFDRMLFSQMIPFAKKRVFGIISSRKPELIAPFLKDQILNEIQ